MTIDEAIKLLKKDSEQFGRDDISYLTEAEQLGIEALKRIGVGRRTGRFSWGDKLPGETKE